jgi:hypothetical protein
VAPGAEVAKSQQQSCGRVNGTPHVDYERLHKRTHILFHGLCDDKVLPQQLSGRLLVTGNFEIPC